MQLSQAGITKLLNSLKPNVQCASFWCSTVINSKICIRSSHLPLISELSKLILWQKHQKKTIFYAVCWLVSTSTSPTKEYRQMHSPPWTTERIKSNWEGREELLQLGQQLYSNKTRAKTVWDSSSRFPLDIRIVQIWNPHTALSLLLTQELIIFLSFLQNFKPGKKWRTFYRSAGQKEFVLFLNIGLYSTPPPPPGPIDSNRWYIHIVDIGSLCSFCTAGGERGGIPFDSRFNIQWIQSWGVA